MFKNFDSHVLNSKSRVLLTLFWDKIFFRKFPWTLFLRSTLVYIQLSLSQQFDSTHTISHKIPERRIQVYLVINHSNEICSLYYIVKPNWKKNPTDSYSTHTHTCHFTWFRKKGNFICTKYEWNRKKALMKFCRLKLFYHKRDIYIQHYVRNVYAIPNAIRSNQ